ncbi:MAG: hypothetical protein IJY93_00550 [Clostridia bacterium]|nr:hypothetical protein [Clostridia bacterium]
MKYTYELTITEKTDDPGDKHTVYGVRVRESGRCEYIRQVDDIFFDKKTAERFVEACNILALDPDHLDDVIADALCV